MSNMQSTQKGVVLAMVLIFLVIMMALGIAAARNATLEERIAGNFRSQQLAFQAAEQALRFCETHIQAGSASALAAGVTFHDPGPISGGANDGKEYWEVESFWKDDAFSTPLPVLVVQNANGLSDPLDVRPRCIVEQMDVLFSPLSIDQKDAKAQFRITARGVGSHANSVVLLQSYLVL